LSTRGKDEDRFDERDASVPMESATGVRAESHQKPWGQVLGFGGSRTITACSAMVLVPRTPLEPDRVVCHPQEDADAVLAGAHAVGEPQLPLCVVNLFVTVFQLL